MGSLLRVALGPKTSASPASLDYYNDQAIALPDFLDHLVKESHKRVSILSETRPAYVQSISVPSMFVWDRTYIQWNFVVQTSGCQVYHNLSVHLCFFLRLDPDEPVVQVSVKPDSACYGHQLHFLYNDCKDLWGHG